MVSVWGNADISMDAETSSILGALAISCESFRGVVNGVPSLLLP